MNTPITDAIRGNVTLVETYAALREVASRLETDRAALMEALEAMLDLWQKVGGNESDWTVEKSETALSTARTNFPTE